VEAFGATADGRLNIEDCVVGGDEGALPVAAGAV